MFRRTKVEVENTAARLGAVLARPSLYDDRMKHTRKQEPNTDPSKVGLAVASGRSPLRVVPAKKTA